MNVENKNRELLGLIITIAVVCTTAMVFYEPNNSVLGYNRDEFHFWQLITAHFVHYDFKHLVSNMLALGLLLHLFPASLKSNFLGIVFAIILIDLYLWFSQVHYYVGYSGLLYVIPGMTFAKSISQQKYIQAITIAIIYAFYVFVSIGNTYTSGLLVWAPLHQTHFLGFFAGMLAHLFIWIQRNHYRVNLRVLNSQLRRKAR